MKSGVRNSLLIAIAPTATIASIAGCYECIEPQISNLFKRETLSGEFLQVNRYLVEDLKARGLWTPEMRTRLKLAEGSIQGFSEIPEELSVLYRTVWEVPMRALIDMAAARNAYIDQIAIAQSLCRVTQYRQALFHVHVCLEAGAQDHLLPAFTARNTHRQSYPAGRKQRSRRELRFAGKRRGLFA